MALEVFDMKDMGEWDYILGIKFQRKSLINFWVYFKKHTQRKYWNDFKWIVTNPCILL